MTGTGPTTRVPPRAGGAPLSVRQRPHQPSLAIDYALLAGPEATSAEDEGYTAGYEAGYTEGRQRAAAVTDSAERERSRQAGQALAALDHSVESLTRAVETRLAELDQAVPRFAFELLDALFQRELALATSPGNDAIERALALDSTSTPATVRLHPDDVATLGSLARLDQGRGVDVVPDPSVEPGGALVEIGETTIDSQLSAALERVRAVLLGDTSGPAGTGDARRAGQDGASDGGPAAPGGTVGP